jgi:hypothetical protein
MDVMSVANIYTALQMNQTQNSVQTGLLRMAIDSQLQTAQNLIQEFSESPVNPDHLGNSIDLYL